MSISIGVNLPSARIANLDIGSPRERETDAALAAQNNATATVSQGLAPERGALERLLEQPGPLARFT